MDNNSGKIIVLCGSTASGKSEVSLKLALEFGGEIISADSMQIYKGLDIGTAKPSSDERRTVPHHLIDVLDMSEPLNVYKFVELAENAISDIRSRGKIPFLVGGSGMYIRALLYGLDPLPGDDGLRKLLELEFGSPQDFDKLRKVMKSLDPTSFSRWKDNQRKLLRAMEVKKLTGKSILELQKTWAGKMKYDTVSLFLLWERGKLKKRIEERTDAMLKKGWIKEAEKMIGKGLFNTPTARQSLGYSIIGSFLGGEIDFSTMRQKIITATWQFARRQETWFKNKYTEAETVPMPVDYSIFLEKIRSKLQQSILSKR